MVDLACVVVHWNVPDLLAECLESLLQEADRLRARGLAVDVLVVDNASRPGVRERLRAQMPEGVRVLWSEENLGYSRACNRAYVSTGAPLVLLSNPDVIYLPGSVEALVRALEAEPEAALAGPAAWWDRQRTFLLNPGYPEDRARIEADAEARRAGAWPAHALAWQRRMARVAFSSRTRAIDVLSGACLLARRERIDLAGGLFDGELFLYYEDTDLCHRLRSSLLPALYVPAAEVIHLFNQSRQGDVANRMAVSRRHYLAKHYGAAEAERLLRLAAQAVPGEEEFSAWRVRDLGAPEGPPVLAWQAAGPSLFTLGLNPQVVPAALARPSRPEIRLDPRFWDQLAPGPYWARATDPGSERVLGYWKFRRP